jgi:4-alpha-glucanotransferase
MNSPELMRAAQARGVATSYQGSGGREVTVAPATIEAVLAALGDPPAPGQDGPGPDDADTAAWTEAVAPGPQRRSWGLTIQLYAVRSAASWGHGDFRDLAGLAAWSARELGAGFVLINPLHTAEPVAPISTSPERGHLSALARPLQAAAAAGELIDRDAVWAAKRTALKILHQVPMSADRQADYERFQAQGGDALRDWATWCVLAEAHGPDWRQWPAGLARPGLDAVEAERSRLSREADFHAWLQWLAEAQLAAAQGAARAAGMPIGIITDLAVGCHPGGADAWAWRDVLVTGMSVGAPPDEFNQRGQDWNQPPWHPQRLAAQDYAPLAGLMGAGLRHAGGLRVDHVMGLFRLWWVPEGMSPDQGTYVHYDHEGMVGVLAGQAAGAGSLAVGEDLGTVEPWIQEYLAGRGILGTSMLWFERGPDGVPLPPGKWRRNCLAMVGTHDVPPVAAFVTGEQVELRSRLGLLTRGYAEERRDAEASVAALSRALTAEGLLEPGQRPSAAEFTVACYAYLARTPALLVGVSLPDAVGDRRPQNMPGTTSEYPNWRVPLCDGEGRAVSLDELADSRSVREVARVLAGLR